MHPKWPSLAQKDTQWLSSLGSFNLRNLAVPEHRENHQTLSWILRNPCTDQHLRRSRWQHKGNCTNRQTTYPAAHDQKADWGGGIGAALACTGGGSAGSLPALTERHAPSRPLLEDNTCFLRVAKCARLPLSWGLSSFVRVGNFWCLSSNTQHLSWWVLHHLSFERFYQ